DVSAQAVKPVPPQACSTVHQKRRADLDANAPVVGERIHGNSFPFTQRISGPDSSAARSLSASAAETRRSTAVTPSPVAEDNSCTSAPDTSRNAESRS